jgi:Ca2+-binding RTX toxin-like protein
VGRGGNEVLIGLRGGDSLDGDDFLEDGLLGDRSYDAVLGGDGNDFIVPFINRPARKDLVQCGSGIDTAYVDAKDETQGCERTRRDG